MSYCLYQMFRKSATCIVSQHFQSNIGVFRYQNDVVKYNLLLINSTFRWLWSHKNHLRTWHHNHHKMGIMDRKLYMYFTHFILVSWNWCIVWIWQNYFLLIQIISHYLILYLFIYTYLKCGREFSAEQLFWSFGWNKSAKCLKFKINNETMREYTVY